MGLSIHYNGIFNENASLAALIEEVKDIAEIFKWKYLVYENDFPQNNFARETFNEKIYGIIISPPECEPVYLSFLSNGRLSSPVHLEFYGHDKAKADYLYKLSTKTQYAGIDVHKTIIHLFKYLSPKYFRQFTLIDEGKYWETGDENLLSEIFQRYNRIMDNFAAALENIPLNEGEDVETYIQKLFLYIKDKGHDK